MNHARTGRTQKQNHLRDVFRQRPLLKIRFRHGAAIRRGIRLLAILLEQLRRKRGPTRLVARPQALAGVSVEILVEL